MPNDSSDEYGPVADLANEYLERVRLGEEPSVEEYVSLRPDLEAQIREIFPMLDLVDNHGPVQASKRSEAQVRVAELELDRLGDFLIQREIGRGGMGVVYEAIQESLGRHVALKVFQAKSHLNPLHRQRFQRESRSAAMLHHTNIVPVFAVGEEDGIHYYAMQFIRGAGLDEVIEQLRQIRHAANPNLSPSDVLSAGNDASRAAQSLLAPQTAIEDKSRDSMGGRPKVADNGEVPESVVGTRSEGADGEASESGGRHGSSNAARSDMHRSNVFLPGQTNDSASFSDSGSQYWYSVARIGVQVAEALDYAHEQGTLHRDIKPSNLLLDHNATVWVTDFGLAKSLQEDDLTNTGELVGTLRYMSPEQFAGRADERSDLYSLGLTLYELLILRPAYDSSDRHALLRSIAEREPISPRKVNSRIPRDLETIVLKTIERDPVRRYQSAHDLARDLTRFLNREPIQARPITNTERLFKWGKRRPAIAAMSTALVFGCIVSFGLITWKWRDAETARSELRLERDEARQLQVSERNAKLREAAERQRKEQLLEQSERNLYYGLIRQAQFELHAGDISRSRLSLQNAAPQYRNWEWHYLQGRIQTNIMTLQVGTQAAPWIRALALSPDGQLLATGSSLPEFFSAQRGPPGLVSLWDLRTGTKILDFGKRTQSVTSLAFSPDGRRLAVAETDTRGLYIGPVRIWDIASREPVVDLTNIYGSPQLDPTVDLQFSPDGSFLAGKRRTSTNFGAPDGGLASAVDDHMHVWDALTGQLLWSRKVTSTSIQFSAGNTIVARLFKENGDPHDAEVSTFAEFEARTGKVLREFASPVGYRDPSNQRVVRWGPEEFKVFDAQSHEMLSTLRDPQGRMGVFAFRPDGSQIAAASLDGSIRVFDLATGALQSVLPGHSTQLLSLRYSSDGHYIVSGDWDGLVKVWEADANREYRAHAVAEDVAFRLDGAAVASIDYYGSLSTWDTLTGILLSTRKIDIFFRTLSHARQAVFDGTGSQLVGASREDPHVLVVWDVESAQEKFRLAGHEHIPHLLAFSTAGNRVASAEDGPAMSQSAGRIIVWDSRPNVEIQNEQRNISEEGSKATNSRQLFEIAVPGQQTTGLALSSDGSYLAAAGSVPPDRNDAQAHWFSSIWRLPQGSRIDLDPIDEAINAVQFSRDSTLLAVCHEDGLIVLYATSTGQRVRSIRGPTGLEDVCFNPDGSRLAGVTREQTILWDAHTGHEVITLRKARKIADPIFNPTVLFDDHGVHLASIQRQPNYSLVLWSAYGPDDNKSSPAESELSELVSRRNPLEALTEQLNNLDAHHEAGSTNPQSRYARARLLSQLKRHGELESELTKLNLNKRDSGYLTLTGREYIEAPNIDFASLGSFTVEAWTRDWIGEIAFQGYGYDWNPTLKESALQFNPATVLVNAGSGSESKFLFDNTHRLRFTAVETSDWTHHALTYDRHEELLSCFKNGQLSDRIEGVEQVGPFNPERPIWIGHFRGGLNSIGQLRSIRVTRAAIYRQDFEPSPSLDALDDTVLLYDFSDRSHLEHGQNSALIVSQVEDLSGMENHGRIVGAWWLPTSTINGLAQSQVLSTREDINDRQSTLNADEKTNFPSSIQSPSGGTRRLWARRLQNIERMVDAEPDNAWYRIGKAKILARSGDYQQSQQELANSIGKISGSAHGLYLHRDQHIEAPHFPFDQHASFTVEAWVKNWKDFLTYQANDYSPGLLFDHRQGVFCFRELGETGYRFANAAEYRQQARRFRFDTPSSDAWVHLAVVRDGDRLLSFSDGRAVSVLEDLPQSAPLDRNQPLRIGGVPVGHYLATVNRAGSGVLRAFRVSTSARYAEDFEPEKDLAADEHTALLFDFADRPGFVLSSRIEDRSGHGNHGVLHNAWWLPKSSAAQDEVSFQSHPK